MPASTALIVLPLLGAFLFTFGALLLKRASDFGAGLWRTAFICNCIASVLFASLLGFGGPPVRWELLWQPLCIALCLFAGMLAQFIALEKGDVSVAVPVLGLKVSSSRWSRPCSRMIARTRACGRLCCSAPWASWC
ncbi:MAG: hypothetical protein ABI318_03005 [Chthoniobacteraceae bacterium]